MNLANLADSLTKPRVSLRNPLRVPPQFDLPLVSVVIVNHNYGRFLEAAVDSVVAQSYANVECIVVDDASTDETPAVLTMLKERLPQLTVVERTENAGQTAASLDGLATAKGQYVIFLDADDVLLPHCVETHIYVHLSSRLHVGFTAGDMLQACDGKIIVATGEAMNRYIRSGRGMRANIWRPYRCEPDWPPSAIGDDLRIKARYVPPLSTHWVWSPTSGLCYRRDALELFADNMYLRNLRTGTDMYFAHGIGGWCGSILIDEPVFVYRIHGTNLYSRKPQLHNALIYEPGGQGDNNDKAIALIVDQLVSRSDRFAKNLLLKLYLIVLLFGLTGQESDQSLPNWAKRSSAAHRLVMHFDSFATTFGRPLTYVLMALFRVPWCAIGRCARHGA